MTLQDIYDQLHYGELRQLFLGSGDDAATGVPKENFKKLLPSVKLGLTALHTRFCLREGTTTVTLVEGTQSYFLTETDLLKIERVYGIWDEREYEIPLNVIDDPRSIRTPTFNALLIPDDAEQAEWLSETTELRVVYRQEHPAIDANIANAAPSITTINLPMTHLEPLLLFIASRLHNPIGMNPGAMHEGNNYKALYEDACQRLEQYGFDVDNDAVNERLERNGWV